MIGDFSDAEEVELYDEWKNIILRESLALSSMIKIRKIKASTFLTKGRLNEIGQYVMENKIDCVFFNYTLSPVQKRNIEV